jgi:hypothetical protein
MHCSTVGSALHRLLSVHQVDKGWGICAGKRCISIAYGASMCSSGDHVQRAPPGDQAVHHALPAMTEEARHPHTAPTK